MRVVIQRTREASVSIDNQVKCSITKGLVILLGIEDADIEEDIEWLCAKIVRMRIFDDANGIMNLPITETDGEILVISQFTLHASTKKGNRPSYIRASKPEFSIPMYEKFISTLTKEFGKEIKTGIFGADMKIGLINDGPVTIIMDSKNKE